MANVSLALADGEVANKGHLYNFVIDSAQIEDLSEFLTNKADELESTFTKIFDEINAMELDAWAGASYNNFKAKCYEYKPAMETLVAVFRAYVSILKNEVTDASQALSDALNGAFEHTILEEKI